VAKKLWLPLSFVTIENNKRVCENLIKVTDASIINGWIIDGLLYRTVQ